MAIIETELWKYLSESCGVVKTKRIARLFGVSRYDAGRVMSKLREGGVVKHMRAGTWRVDFEALKELKERECGGCEVV